MKENIKLFLQGLTGGISASLIVLLLISYLRWDLHSFIHPIALRSAALFSVALGLLNIIMDDDYPD